MSGGYRNPTIRLDFPDLAQEGDRVFVIIRNPRTMAPGELRSAAGKVTEADEARFAAAKAAMDATGAVPDDLANDEDENRGYAIMAKLVLSWRVWDATVPIKIDEETGDLIHDEETAPRLLPLPATPALIGKVPGDILAAITEELQKANPQARRATGTSKTS